MESAGLEFHEKVAEGYRTLAARHPERIMTVDAALPIQQIHDKIIEVIEEKIQVL
ncbi:MAG: dTMP kinase, partial [Lachnospiraceae bacterium]|nr:dTMP kinase [Lachnospiraceae bacterium]